VLLAYAHVANIPLDADGKLTFEGEQMLNALVIKI
jgi:hypothetical protein